MRKSLVVLLITVLIVMIFPTSEPTFAASSKWDGSIDTTFSGNGTESSPYLITSAAELAGLAQICQTDASATTDKYYALITDIDLASREWVPIGTRTGADTTHAFQGSFDGRGHTIRNLSITTKYGSVGLFGYVTNSSSSSCYIKNLVVSGSINITTSCGCIGGIVGSAFYHTISNCANEVNIQAPSSGGIGGICGTGRKLEYVRNDGSITLISGTGYVGGICGELPYSTDRFIKYALNTGTITNNASGSEAGGTGGIVGKINSSSSGGAQVIQVSYICNTGTVSGRTSVCGIAGVGTSVSNAINYASVTYLNGNAGHPITKGGSGSSCYYLADATSSTTNPKGLTAAQMRQQSSFEGFDFDTVWVMGPNYPELRAFKFSGTVSVSGSAKYGNTVSISKSNLKTYYADYCTAKWYRSGTQVGTGNSYTIQAADIGMPLTVRLTSTHPLSSGTLTSTAVTATKGTNPDSPIVPTLLSKSDSSITVEAVEGQEYSLDNSTWQSDGTFNDLKPLSEYTVYSRLAATDLYLASAASEGLSVTTDRRPINGSVSISGTAEFTRTVTADLSGVVPTDATMEVSWMNGLEVLGTGMSYALTSEDVGKSIYFIAEGSGAYSGSIMSDGVEVQPFNIEDVNADAISDFTFTSEPFTPSIVLRNNSALLIADEDYICDYSNNVDAGTAQVIAIGQGNYTGTKRINFTILPRNINAVSFNGISSYTYDGTAFTPALTGSYASQSLQKGRDYTVTYSNNVNAGKAAVAVTGCNNFTGTITKYFTINPKSLSGAVVTLPSYEFSYNESEIKPVPTVTLDGSVVNANNYDVSYSNNIREGVAKVIVTGKNNYMGSVSVQFTISGHVYSDWIIEKAATCQETGLQYKICSGCDDRIEEQIPKTGHTFNGVTIIDKATCTTDGHEQLACTVCGEVDAYYVIHAYGHNYSDWIIEKEATCKEEGLRYQACSRCGDRIEEQIPKTEHIYGEMTVVKDATCEEEGYQCIACTICGDIREQETIPKHGHSYSDWIIEKEATCKEGGLQYKICSRCSGRIEEQIPKTAHNPNNAVIENESAATCIHDGGYDEVIYCKDCGIELSRKHFVIECLGQDDFNAHLWRYVESVPATSTRAGMMDHYKCSECGMLFDLDGTPIDAETLIIPCTPSATTVDSGTCGDKITWKLDSNGKLVLSGSGPMQTYSSSWDTSLIKSVVIGDGITSISNYAFYNCANMTSISIPDSVKSIGYNAFENCSSLRSVLIPYKVTDIAQHTFYKCSSLKAVIIPNTITRIEQCAFQGCSSLSVFAIPDGVTKIEYDTFYGCSSLASITIPDSVTTIGGYAFYGCSNLKNVTIPNSVTNIDFLAFTGSGLENLTIPDSITSIGNSAFQNCAALKRITIPDKQIRYGEKVFNGCGNLSEIHVPNIKMWISFQKTAQLKSKKHLFIDGVELTSVTIPSNITSLGDYAFYWCENLTSISIPNSVTAIGEAAFYRCSSLTDIMIPDSVKSIGKSAFYECTDLKSITIPDSVTSIGSYAFLGCSNLKDIILPDSITDIGEYSTFHSCTSLTSITIPEKVTRIGDYIFSGCSNLTSVTIPEGVTSIGEEAFRGCNNLRRITIPEGVTDIDATAFSGCSNLRLFVYPGSAAETYAKKMGIRYRYVGEVVADNIRVDSKYGLPVINKGEKNVPVIGDYDGITSIIDGCSVDYDNTYSGLQTITVTYDGEVIQTKAVVYDPDKETFHDFGDVVEIDEKTELGIAGMYNAEGRFLGLSPAIVLEEHKTVLIPKEIYEDAVEAKLMVVKKDTFAPAAEAVEEGL